MDLLDSVKHLIHHREQIQFCKPRLQKRMWNLARFLDFKLLFTEPKSLHRKWDKSKASQLGSCCWKFFYLHTLSLSVCLSVCLSVSVSLCGLCLSVCLSLSAVSVCLSVSLSLSLSHTHTHTHTPEKRSWQNVAGVLGRLPCVVLEYLVLPLICTHTAMFHKRSS